MMMNSQSSTPGLVRNFRT
ncbi:hypothetical protein LINPERHAP1_LOCUS31600 [Linum perenne]